MKCKRETDGRRLDRKEAIRLRAVRMMNKGFSSERVAKDLDINRRTIYSWLEKYHHDGWRRLSVSLGPRAKPKLTAEQLAKFYRMVAWSDPR